LKHNIKKKQYDGVEGWVHLIRDSSKGSSCEHENKLLGKKCGEFQFEQLRDYQLPNASAPPS
jgi:hypothetical protein